MEGFIENYAEGGGFLNSHNLWMQKAGEALASAGYGGGGTLGAAEMLKHLGTEFDPSVLLATAGITAAVMYLGAKFIGSKHAK